LSESYVKADFSKLEKLIEGLGQDVFVDVGVLEGGTYENGETVAYIGAVHEFGTDKAGRGKNVTIPERSFIKMPIEEKQDEITKKAEIDLAKNLAEGKVDFIMMRIGIACDIAIQEAFETGGFGKWPQLAQSTIDGKGSSAILIDQGTLSKHISYKVGKK
jgi:phage gpG-like protein